MYRYKWRQNLTLKARFNTPYTSYTCIHDDTPRNHPCQEPSHYDHATLTFSRDELVALNWLVYLSNVLDDQDILEIQRKVKFQMELTEYPYEEGY